MEDVNERKFLPFGLTECEKHCPPKPPGMCGRKGTYRAEAESNGVDIHFAVDAQCVYLLWADPVGIQQSVLSVHSHLHRRKTVPSEHINRAIPCPNTNVSLQVGVELW